MQTLDVQAPKSADHARPKGQAGTHAVFHGAMNGKTGAETARNGSSFLAMIDKMIAGAMDGKADGLHPVGRGIAGRGAGDAKAVPGDRHTLNNKEGGKDGKKSPLVSVKGSDDHLRRHSGSHGVSANAEESQSLAEKPEREPARFSYAESPNARSAQTEGGIDPRGVSGDALRSGKKAGSSRQGIDGTDAAQNAGMLFSGSNARLALVTQKRDGDQAAGIDSASGVKGGKTARNEKKAVINVRDERTGDGTMAATDSPFAKNVKVNGDGSADMSIAFRNAENGKGSLAGEESRVAEKRDGDGKSFASMLSQELRSNAADFVKTGAIVLRDNNVGTIRLTLHPESLGNVKISLELSGDRKISGKIVVSSEEAYEAFNESLGGLSDAFVEGGFQSAGFDLSFAGENGAGRGSAETGGNASSPFYASSIPDVMSGTERVDSMSDGYRTSGFSAINVFA